MHWKWWKMNSLISPKTDNTVIKGVIVTSGIVFGILTNLIENATGETFPFVTIFLIYVGIFLPALFIVANKDETYGRFEDLFFVSVRIFLYFCGIFYSNQSGHFFLNGRLVFGLISLFIAAIILMLAANIDKPNTPQNK